MAEMQESGSTARKGKNRQKKMSVRVDFTPMVDMNMLLITFFMLCTTLSKPQTMEISMPSNDKNITEEQQSKVKASQAITLLLAGDDRLFYYYGEPDYTDYASLHPTAYAPDGLRAMLMQRSATGSPTVIIKATDDASYKNLVDALDEMHICSIEKYVIAEMAEGDEFLMENYDTKGSLSGRLAKN